MLLIGGVGLRRLISIGGGEPEYKTPEHIIDAMKEAMDEGHTHYGNFRHIPELREAVAAKYRRLGVDADPEHVLITPGSTMGIYMVFNGLMEPGDDLLTFDPCFFGYFHSQRLLGFNPVPVTRYKDENWRFHVEDLYKAATPKTKALLICSPDNPTGAVLGDNELKGIAEFAQEKDITVISDDIYDEITYDGARFRSIASLPGMSERTVILNGLSKAYAMTGWRVGYAIAPDEKLYEKFFEIQMSTFLVVNAAVQRASVAALTGPQDCVREMVAEYDEKRRFVLDAYGEMPGVNVTRPEGAFYLFPDVSSYGMSSPKMAEYLREEARVAITPGHLFGSNGEGHIRNAFCQSMGDLSEGLDRIKKALGKL
jgi:aminotransferase